MTVLVTGAAGFIGSETSRALLARGEPVVGIDNLNDYYDPALKRARIDRLDQDFGDAFTFETLDFAEAQALADLAGRHRIGGIVHLGAQAGVRHSIDSPASYVRSNLVGHCNLLELARDIDCPHLVYASSSSVYGGNETMPFDVDDPADHPRSLYAATKRADELLSESYAALYDLPMTGLRFFTVYGPWGRPDMAAHIFTKAIFEGTALPLYNNGRMRRDFTFIDDIVAGVVAALDRPPANDGSVKPGGSRAPHALYNLGRGKSEELGRMIVLLEQAIGRPALIEPMPMQMGDVTDTFADIRASERDLGYRPTISIDEGIPRFVEWYRDYYKVD